MYKNKKLLVLALLAFAFARLAHADFVNEAAPTPAPAPKKLADAAPAQPTPAPPAVLKPTITEVGERPKDIAVVTGKGQDIALGDVLPVIVPPKFKIELSNVDRTRRINWNGGIEWFDTLSKVVAQLPNVDGIVDWNQAEVILSSAPAAGQGAVEVVEYNAGAWRSLKNQSSDAVASAPAAAKHPSSDDPVGVWAVKKEDGMFSVTLARWAKQAGWQVSWEIPRDFPTEIEDTFKGTFTEAVDQATDAWAIADYPPKPCYHENKVVRIVRKIGDNRECVKR